MALVVAGTRGGGLTPKKKKKKKTNKKKKKKKKKKKERRMTMTMTKKKGKVDRARIIRLDISGIFTKGTRRNACSIS